MFQGRRDNIFAGISFDNVLRYRSSVSSEEGRNILRGIGTVPAFLEKVHGAMFVDAGQVWDGDRTFHGNDTKLGAGVELRADMTIGYWAKVTPAIGFAHGFNRDGENQLYFTLYLGL